MAMVNPGVSFSETLLNTTPADDVVTTPLFIAYTVTQAERVPVKQPVRVASLTEATSQFGSDGTLADSLRHFFDNGGLSCYVLSLGSWTGEEGQRPVDLIAQLQSADVQEAIAGDHATGLLLVPEMSELNDLIDEEDKTTEDRLVTLWYQGWQALLQMRAPGTQRFVLLEMPETSTLALKLSKKTFSADLTQNGAAWWPRLQIHYRDDSAENAAWRLLSPLPAVAAVIQANASREGVWKAPANIRVAKTLRPTKNIFQEQTLLNQQGVYSNLVRSFAGKGVRLWGCRTLLNDESSPWRYIQTRLLVNSVETQMRKLSRVFLFEPNNAQTWMKLKGQLWTWLRQQWLAGAFYGATEEEAFSLNVGLGETMDAADIAAGKMILQVRLALLAPTEFIDLSLTLDMRDGSEIRQNGS